MTVTQSDPVTYFEGNGVTTSFSYPSYLLRDADLDVYVGTDGDLGTLKTLNSDYTLSGTIPGGSVSVVMNTPPATGQVVALVRSTPLTQPINFEKAGGSYLRLMERAADQLTRTNQELNSKFDRVLRLSDTEMTDGINPIPDRLERASKFLSFDTDGQPEAAILDPETMLGYQTSAIAAAAAAASSAAAIAAAMTYIDSLFASVVDYGITGDAATDATTQWNLAIADLNAGTIKALYIPGGWTVRLNGSHTTEITANDAIIFGDGQDVSKITMSAGAGTSAKFFSFNGAQDFTIRGIGFYNLNSTSLVAGSWQFEAYDCARVTLEDIWQQGGPFLRMGGATVGPNQMKLRNVTGSAYKALGSPHVLVEDCSGALWQDVRFGADNAAAHADFRFVKLCPQVGDNIDTMTIRDFIANETQNDVATTFEIDFSYDDIGTITIDRTNLEQSLKGLHVHNNNGSTGFLSRLSLTNVRTTPRITTAGSVGFHVQNTNNKLTTISASMCTFSAGNGPAIKVEGTASDLGHLDLEIGNSVIVDRRQGLGGAKSAVEIGASGVAIRDCKFLSSRTTTTDVDYITGSTFSEAVKFTADVRRAIVTGNDFQTCTAAEVIDTTLITGLASGSTWAINNNLGATAIVVYPDTPADIRTAIGVAVDVQSFGTTRAAIVAAIAYATARARPVEFTPLAAGSYYEGDTGNISIPANMHVLGSYDGPIRVNSTTLNPLFLVAGADVVIDGIKCVGNQATQRSTSSGSVAISATSVARPVIKNCYITDFTRHGILVDGCSDPEIINNRIENIYIGSGILAGSTIACTGFTRIVGNRVKNTQQGNIQGYLGPDNLLVADNVCDTTNWGSGSLADNITFYTAADGSNYIITGNHCKGSGNHGIHVGADEMTITGNNIVGCQAHGIFTARASNTDPAIMTGVTIANNVIKNCNLAVANYCGIAVRNADGIAIANNVIDGAGYGIELYGLGTVLNVTNGYVTGNIGRNITTAGIYRRGTLSDDLVVENNPGLTDPNKPKKTNRVLSGTFAIDSTGKKSVIIPHGLHSAPTSKDVQFALVEDSNVDNFAIDHIKFASADATNVVVEVIVGTATATVGGVARLAMWVDITTKYS